MKKSRPLDLSADHAWALVDKFKNRLDDQKPLRSRRLNARELKELMAHRDMLDSQRVVDALVQKRKSAVEDVIRSQELLYGLVVRDEWLE